MEPQTKAPPVVIIKNYKEEKKCSADSHGICYGVLGSTLFFLGLISVIVIYLIDKFHHKEELFFFYRIFLIFLSL